MSVHHVERVQFTHLTEDNDFADLTMLGSQIFEFNTRDHGDYEDSFTKVYGRFIYQHESLHFTSNNALGSAEMVGTNDLYTRVVAYYRFLD